MSYHMDNDEVVQFVARAIYDSDVNDAYSDPSLAPSFGDVEPEAWDEYHRRARAAIEAHFAAHETPYSDEEHQGGNLLELFLRVHADNFRLREENSRLHEGKSCDIRRHRGELVDWLTGEQNRLKGMLATAQDELGRRQRQGQAAMNVLRLVRPDLAEQVHGTDEDCWDDDSRLPALMAWLVRQIAEDILVDRVRERVDRDDGVRHRLEDVLDAEVDAEHRHGCGKAGDC